MRRTLEKLASERKDQEDEFVAKLEAIKERTSSDGAAEERSGLERALNHLKDTLAQENQAPSFPKRGLLSKAARETQPSTGRPSAFDRELVDVLSEFKQSLDDHSLKTKALRASVVDLFERLTALVDTRDREWDALGSNHVGMIFKSLEWRVDKLAAECEDVRLLVKKFLQLKEQLNSLLAAVESKRLPSAPLIEGVLRPLEDWRYAAFENRHRGLQEKIREQQRDYLPYFKAEGKVLDLGCGRGEFLEVLRDNGVDALGIDLNEQMVDICLDKGLRCERGDLLQKLAELADSSLGGIFCSQVVEHLPPAYLRRLIDLAYFKLRAGGVLIAETINPASVFALVEVFYLDLTHEKPIHPLTLRFLLESAGFEDVEIKYSAPLETERLEEVPAADERAVILNRNIDRLNKIIYSPLSYAALGRRR